MTHPVFLPPIGPFTFISRQQRVDHGDGGLYQVVLYGALDRHPDESGIGILIEPKGGQRAAVVCDELGREPGSRWPSAAQIELYESIVQMSWEQFQSTVNRSARKNFRI